MNSRWWPGRYVLSIVSDSLARKSGGGWHKQRWAGRSLRRGDYLEALEQRVLLAGEPAVDWADAPAALLAIAAQPITISSTLPITSGYPRTTVNTASFTGTADPSAGSILVAGQLATWNPGAGTWSIASVPLNPGINRIIARAYQGPNGSGNKINEAAIDIWYDKGSVTNVSGTLAAGTTTWTPSGGPYSVTASLTVPVGSTLIIQPGTSVYFASSTSLTVNGTIVAEGTDLAHIRFTRRPGVNANWSGLKFVNNQNDNRLAFFEQAYAGSGGFAGANPNIAVTASRISVDHGTWLNTTFQIINVTNSSFKLTNSTLPSVSVEPVHVVTIPAAGYALIQGNTFAKINGFNDVMDISGGQRPGAIVQILDNVFNGSDDDILDLDGTDAHIEGNIFRGAHLTNPANADTSSAISGGQDSGNIAEYVIVRNWFYDLDHAVLAKEGNTAQLINNTIFNMRVAAINFDEPLRSGIVPGKGAHLDGNIIWNVPIVLENVDSDGSTTQLTTNRNIAPIALSGVGNSTADPRFVNSSAITDPRIDLALLSNSPAIGAGPNGRNMGAGVPVGASISGEPAATTSSTTATLLVGGPDIYAYKYRLDNGNWSAEVATSNPGLADATIPPIQLGSLSGGPHTVYVVEKNSAGAWQPDSSATASRTWTVSTVPPSVANRRVFYNESLYDGENAAADAADDGAIAPDKSALLPGNSATLSNYTNYSRGLNGVMLDLNNYGGIPTLADFTFKVGNDNSPAVWPLAPVPASIAVRGLSGPGSQSRVTITWADGAIHGAWLQVTAKTSLGLAQPDVFYFGNAVGEAGNSPGDTVVDANDEIAARNNPRTFRNPAPIDSLFDFNRDAFVNAADQILARSNATPIGAKLNLIAIPDLAGVAAALMPESEFTAVVAAEPREAGSLVLPASPPAIVESKHAPELIATTPLSVSQVTAANPTLPAAIAPPLPGQTLALDHAYAAELDDELLDLLSRPEASGLPSARLPH